MSSTKNALVFVGKSLAFAVIAGVVWCAMLIFVASFSTRARSGTSSSDDEARVTRQVETYDRQVKESQEQMNRNAELQERSAKLLDTQERLFAEQEQLQRRLAVILDKWERTPAR